LSNKASQRVPILDWKWAEIVHVSTLGG
jgi:hypothetical protein